VIPAKEFIINRSEEKKILSDATFPAQQPLDELTKCHLPDDKYILLYVSDAYAPSDFRIPHRSRLIVLDAANNSRFMGFYFSLRKLHSIFTSNV